MTRKHYELIAGALRVAREMGGDVATHDRVAERTAAALAADNPRFNAQRFLTAAGHIGVPS